MIADAIRKAQQLHRKVIEGTYDGKCSVYEQREAQNPDTKVTDKKEALVLENVPCHLSYSGGSAAGEADPAAGVRQGIRLFLAPETEIRPGSRIVVEQCGKKETYGRSGQPEVYATHQEILLELWKGYV